MASAVAVVSASVTAPVPTGTSTPIPPVTPTPTPTATPAPATTPAPTPAPGASSKPGKPLIVAEGDSISIYWGGSYPGQYAAQHPNVSVVGVATGGATILHPTNGLVQRAPSTLALKPTWLTVLIGANDLMQYTQGQQWLDSLWSYVATFRAAGVKVAVGTVLPICLTNNPGHTARFNERRALVNPMIRDAVGTKIDAVIDFAADPDMGTDAGACDARWYKDGLHPTDAGLNFTGGQGRMAKIYGAAMDRALQ